MKRLLMSMWFVAASVQGQQTVPPPKPALETVEVVGHRERLGKEVLNFVSKLTQLDGVLVSSWNVEVCPKVVAEDPSHAEYIRQRLLEVAAEVPFAANPDKACRANLFVVLTNSPEEFIEGWKERDPGMFIWRPRRGVSRSPDTLPVRTWHNVSVEGAGGAAPMRGLAASSNVGAKSSALGDIPTTQSAGGGSRIVSVVSENLHSVLVLVDTNQAAGVTLRQLADYIALVSFSKVDLEADFGQSDSILRLFAGDEATARPTGLTRWDIAFLRGLYRQSYEAVRQRGAIASRMVRDLIDASSDAKN
jgi:hypothetical protein